MDQKHREYCIKLGNPFMREEKFEEQFKTIEAADSSWIPEDKIENEDWFKNKKQNF